MNTHTHLSRQNTVSVIGAGAWGTAIAQTIAAQGRTVTLWARHAEIADTINTKHMNEKYLNGITLSPMISVTNDLGEALKSKYIFMVTPAQSMRFVLANMAPHIRKDHALILCSKGIEMETCLMMSEVVHFTLPETSVAIMSGPNFAHDIARGKPAATTLACSDLTLGESIQQTVASPHFRPYLSDDIIGTQISGALKNVIAIACGICRGLDMGESARASLVTRGLAEITRLGVAMGAKTETFMGLSGVGDMMLTCSSEQSRNFSLGYALGQRQSLKDVLNTRETVTEGVHTAKSAVKLAKKHCVDLPICTAIHKFLNEGHTLDEALQDMLNRPIGHEC